MIRTLSIGCLLLLSSACARVSADVSGASLSSESPSDESPAAATEQPVAVGPIPSECVDDELSTCASSCSDPECLEWCAGESCATLIADLWSCMDEGERRFASEHPFPQPEYEQVTTEDGDSYEDLTAESLAREYEWQDAHDRALNQRWSEACERLCTTRMSREDETVSSFCSGWDSSYPSWARLSKAPADPKPPAKNVAFGALSTGLSLDLVGGFLGTSMLLAGELAQRPDDPHIAALRRMLSHASWKLGDADKCVANLDESGREFAIAVEFDPDGVVRSAHVRDDSSGGECVANLLASTLTLPIRVAREYPHFEVRVIVRPQPTGLFGNHGFSDGAGSIWGGSSGDDYRPIGTGVGGGGDYRPVDDEGYGGLGSIGTTPPKQKD